MRKKLFPYPHCNIDQAITKFAKDLILPSGRVAKEPHDFPLDQYSFVGFEYDGGYVKRDVRNNTEKFYLVCQKHKDASPFETEWRAIFSSGNARNAILCPHCAQEIGKGYKKSTYADLSKQLKNVEFELDDDLNETPPHALLDGNDYLHGKCTKTIDNDKQCNHPFNHKVSNLLGRIRGYGGSVVCQGQCDSARKGKSRRTPVEDYESALFDIYGGEWNVKKNSFKKVSANAWHESSDCAHEVHRLCQSFLKDKEVDDDKKEFVCPFCTATSPLALLNKEKERYASWVSHVSKGAIKFLGNKFPANDRSNFACECTLCNKKFDNSQEKLLRNEHYGCQNCAQISITRQRAWRIEDARDIVSRRNLKLLNNPGNYLNSAAILGSESTSILEVCKRYPMTAEGPNQHYKGSWKLKPNNWDKFRSGQNFSIEEKIFYKMHSNTLNYWEMAIQTGRSEGAVKQLFRREGWLNNNRENINRLCVLDDDAFSLITEESAYWAGLLAADGTIHKCGNKVSLELIANDEHHLANLLGFVGSNGALSYRSMKSVDGRGIYACCSINSKKISSDLKKNFNLKPNKSTNILPPKLDTLKQRHAYLLGLFDGDGTYRYAERRRELYLNIVTASLIMAEWIADEFGGILGKSIPVREVKRSSTLYIVELSCNEASKVLSSLYASFQGSLPRKRLSDELLFVREQGTYKNRAARIISRKYINKEVAIL